MRRFELVEGTSAKFWEIECSGAQVAVTFGRIGTNGQQQVKDLGTEAAATAHHDKLVAEKVRKGYVEQGEARSVLPPIGASAAEQSPAQSTEQPAQQPAPAAEPAVPAAVPSGEDELVIPPAWRRLIHPRRDDDPPPRAVTIKSGVHERVGEFVRAGWERAARLFDPAHTERRVIDAVADGTSPLSAGAVVVALSGGSWNDGGAIMADFADAWVSHGGLEFASRAVAEAAGLYPDGATHYGGSAAFIRTITDNDDGSDWRLSGVGSIAIRLREHLAAADEPEYRSAVGALTEYRGGPFNQRLTASYLVPERRDWAAADLARVGPNFPPPSRLAVAVAATAAEAEAVTDRVDTWAGTTPWGLVVTMADSVGPGVARALAKWCDGDPGADVHKKLVGLLSLVPTDEAFALLLDRSDSRHYVPALSDAARRFPRRAMRMLAERAGTSATGRVAADLLRAHVRAHPELAESVRGSASPAVAGRIASFEMSTLPDADPGSLPTVLTAPPWKRRRTRVAPVVVDGLEPPTGVELRWLPGEREQWSTRPVWPHEPWNPDWNSMVAEHIKNPRFYVSPTLFLYGPERLVRPLLRSWQPVDLWGEGLWLRALIARYGLESYPAVMFAARAKPTNASPALEPFVSAEVAALMAESFARRKTLRALALRWFERHGVDAAQAIVPAALGTGGPVRRAAEAVLFRLAPDVVRAAAQAYGPEAASAIEALVTTDPLDMLPARIPAVPSWLDVSVLPQVLTPGRETALPRDAVANLITIFTLSSADDVYAGLEPALAACDPDSVAEFAWEVYLRWAAGGFAAKDGWVMNLLGLVGNDETVRRLAPLIRSWPGDGAHRRAVVGLDVLTAIGSDVALMHLNSIAQKVKFKALRDHAQGKIADVADALGLSPDELADRLVPDLGLDSDGTMGLDYGPRQFVIGFDEQLKPYVLENGKRRATLPKPGAKDDPALAGGAYERFAALKKDVRAVATDQIRRLEAAMVTQRRWSAQRFTTLFVGHPLLVHLVRRLVWTTDSGVSFRVAEDRSLADVTDELFELPANVEVGVAHPLALGDTVGAWRETFADYEILQPFEQLGRDIFTLTPLEQRTHSVERFNGQTARTVKVIALEHRGWQRESPQDAGLQFSVSRPVAAGQVGIGVKPGIVVGDPNADGFDVQTVDGVWLPERLEPIEASELLRDVTWLVT